MYYIITLIPIRSSSTNTRKSCSSLLILLQPNRMTVERSGLQVPDEEVVQRTLSSPPFHTVEGVINFRDFGILSSPPISHQNLEKSSQIPPIRPGVLFRSGELTRLTDKGKAKLKELGITTVFDLRSESEIRKYQSSTPAIDGVRFVHVPVTDTEEYDPMALAARLYMIIRS